MSTIPSGVQSAIYKELQTANTYLSTLTGGGGGGGGGDSISVRQGVDAASITALLGDMINDSMADVNLKTYLTSVYDSIDVNKMSAAGRVIAHNAITATATSIEIDCRGYNSVRIEIEVTAIAGGGIWTPTITASEISGGTFGTIYNYILDTWTLLELPALSTVVKRIYIIKGGIPNFIKITETLSVGTGTVTVSVVPFNS